jgi:RNA polymerase sigma-70 factor (ECF subfamily)
VDQREVFDLRHADGLSYREIAAAVGAPQGTVMSRLARAREKMRACLESKGVTGPASA